MHWMYDHPEATPNQLNEATVQISKDIWNRYYAPVFHQKDVVLLGILLAHDRLVFVFARLPDRAHDRVSNRRANEESGSHWAGNSSAWRRWAA